MAAAPQRRAVLGLSGLLLASCAVAQAGPVGSGLLPGAVPYAYAGWVGRAGALCAAFPPAVIAAQVKTESDWNPRAVGPAPARAQGIAQFLPAAWARYGRDDDGSGTADPLEPGDAIMAMGRYDCALAADLSAGQGSGRLRGDLTSLALAAYNAGVGAVLAARGVPPYPETQDYVARILALAAGYQQAPAPAAGAGVAVVAAAERQIGRPYVYGGGGATGPTHGGFDCSGLVQYAVYQATGGRLVLPRTSDLQRRAGRRVAVVEMRPGDLIAFDMPTDPAPWGHIGIYAGGGQMIHAPHPGSAVRVEPLTTRYWQSIPWDVRRVL